MTFQPNEQVFQVMDNAHSFDESLVNNTLKPSPDHWTLHRLTLYVSKVQTSGRREWIATISQLHILTRRPRTVLIRVSLKDAFIEKVTVSLLNGNPDSNQWTQVKEVEKEPPREVDPKGPFVQCPVNLSARHSGMIAILQDPNNQRILGYQAMFGGFQFYLNFIGLLLKHNVLSDADERELRNAVLAVGAE